MSRSNEAQLKLLTAKKEVLFQRIQRLYDDTTNIKNTKVLENFKIRFNSFQETKEAFNEIMDNINLTNLALDDKFIPDFKALESFQELCDRIQATANQIFNKSSSSSEKEKLTSKPIPKLPTLELPLFSGNVNDWPIFYETFKSLVHENEKLENISKLHYLLGKLTGKALSICSGIPPIASNYEVIWKSLIEKYQDKRLLADSYLKQIFNFKTIQYETAQNLDLFLEKFDTAHSALERLDIPDLENYIFAYLALTKLDKETLKNFEMTHRENALPTYDSIINFVKEQRRVLSRNQTTHNTESNKTPNFNPVKTKLTHSFVANQSKPAIGENKCAFCKNNHSLWQCEKFKAITPLDRYKFAKGENLCLNCLSKNHKIINCKSHINCFFCKKRHHSLLHYIERLEPAVQTDVKIDNPNTDTVTSLCSVSTTRMEYTVLLSTAVVQVTVPDGSKHYIRMIIDSGSQSNLLTLKCCKKLQLKIQKIPYYVAGIGATPQLVRGRTNIVIGSRHHLNFNYSVDALVVEKLTDELPTKHIENKDLAYLNDLPLADENYSKPGEIDGIIGADLFPHLIGTAKVVGPSHLPVALQTTLGYVVMGKIPIKGPSNTSNSFCTLVRPIDKIVSKFWELEEIPSALTSNPEDLECERIFASTVKRESSGRYIVALPFKENPNNLGDSLPTALRRFSYLEKRFETSPQLRDMYNGIMTEHIQLGFMSKLTDEIPSDFGYYVPHHGVYKPSNTSTPLRIVFDASAKTDNGLSLNDIMYKGPKLQTDVGKMLLNFRLFSIAMTSDLKKMFLQILLCPEHRKFQRILWRFSADEPLSVYQFDRVGFGLKAAPYLALNTVRQLAHDEAQSFPLASKVVCEDTYMDNFISSVSNLDQAKTLYHELVNLFRAGGFQLVQWCTNSEKLLNEIPEDHRLSQTMDFDDSSCSVLGLQWHPVKDILSFKVGSLDIKCTKRNILSTIARIFDPIGLLAPVTLYAKSLIQKLWTLKLDWDDRIPKEVENLWLQFYNELNVLEGFQVNRYMSAIENSSAILIGFADASETGYGGMVYIKIGTNIHLVCAKSKVAPLKTISIPRLELSAALLLTRLLQFVISSFRSRIVIERTILCSDSTVTLNWIGSSPHRWQTFVANRVTEIQDSFSPENWFHIAGENNPSDCLSRGLTPAKLVNNVTWLTGPPWLKLDINNWPIEHIKLDDSISLEKKIACLHISRQSNVIYDLISRFSSWPKLVRCIAYILKFIIIKLPKLCTILSENKETAELILLRVVQKEHFKDEIACLEKGKLVARNIQQLRPFLHDGLIRVGGRLANANVSYDQQHPILLPKRAHLVALLIDYYHKINLHAGPNLLLSLLRQSYWIISARSVVRSRVKSCNICFRTRPQTFPPLMADLPTPRVTLVKPFLHTGVDYGGPFFATPTKRRGIRSQKVYLCLFVCLTTRALHLEIAPDLSTDAFMRAFKRFLSRRGPCAIVYSDCGTNFIGAKSHLDSIHEFIQSDNYKRSFEIELNEHKIEWKFNPPSSPHFGGIWEAAIKAVKTHLNRVIGAHILTIEELNTVVTEIEALMNSRPLCCLSPDPSEPLALTPAHFLSLTPLKSLPATNLKDENSNYLSRKHLLDQMVQSYWKRWHIEYLHTLQIRQKWNTPSLPVKVGLIVLVRQDNVPPLHWPLGIITQVFPGKDGVIRVANVKIKDKIYKRPVVRLCPLPTQ